MGSAETNTLERSCEKLRERLREETYIQRVLRSLCGNLMSLIELDEAKRERLVSLVRSRADKYHLDEEEVEKTLRQWGF